MSENLEIGAPKEPHIFYEIPEILSFTKSSCPDNKKVKLVGVYEGTHYLTSFIEFKGQDTYQIPLDMSLVDKYPAIDSVVELYGTLIFEKTPSVLVYFSTNLGYDSNDICDYLQCLRSLKSFVSTN